MAVITVFASFPTEITVPPNLSPDNWRWVACLTLPVDKLLQLNLSLKPYKWIRYAIGVVVGAQGHLSTSSDLLHTLTVDYNINTDEFPTHHASELYYHMSDAEKVSMFPIDPDLGRTNTSCYSTASDSAATSHRVRFRQDVKDRDGEACVLTGYGIPVCDALHLLAHSKGDKYIERHTRNRSRDLSQDVVHDINDPRNGLFLNAMAHRMLGSRLAFLVTPNFAMESTDVESGAAASSSAAQYTSHYLERTEALSNCSLMAMGPGTSLRLPTDASSTQWPPTVLFDAVYASFVLRNFASDLVKTEITTTWKDSFYPEEDLIAQRRQAKDHHNRSVAKKNQQGGPNGLDMLLMIPYLAVPQDKLPDMLKEARQKKRAAEDRRIEEKVNKWRSQLLV